MELVTMLQEKLDWLHATNGVKHAQVKLTAEQLSTVLLALEQSGASELRRDSPSMGREV
ncbi:hypothetical protein [Cupriavidus gilardii]|uniref:hypothetical protein n=1 Tax=Cupriavidus gilardii TaxID=82541 RepID=UPI0021BE33B2|nr:hypothetical protein [Cupriavidus gilardii]MCT9125396.1 hypothetical protein [Cupriavidus gilardii]